MVFFVKKYFSINFSENRLVLRKQWVVQFPCHVTGERVEIIWERKFCFFYLNSFFILFLCFPTLFSAFLSHVIYHLNFYQNDLTLYSVSFFTSLAIICLLRCWSYVLFFIFTTILSFRLSYVFLRLSKVFAFEYLSSTSFPILSLAS